MGHPWAWRDSGGESAALIPLPAGWNLYVRPPNVHHVCDGSVRGQTGAHHAERCPSAVPLTFTLTLLYEREIQFCFSGHYIDAPLCYSSFP